MSLVNTSISHIELYYCFLKQASALENEVKILRQQVYELQQSLAASRYYHLSYSLLTGKVKYLSRLEVLSIDLFCFMI